MRGKRDCRIVLSADCGQNYFSVLDKKADYRYSYKVGAANCFVSAPYENVYKLWAVCQTERDAS